jgi:hypothetical protein
LIEAMNFQLAKTVRGLVAGLTLACAVSSAATAQDISESHFAAARAALAAIDATDPYDNILPVAAEQLKARLISNNIDLEAEISQIVDDQAIALVKRRGDLENEAARVYASAFSEDELKAIADFYTSEAGRKLLESGPIAAREIANAARIWGAGIERDLLENVTNALNAAGLRANTGGEAEGTSNAN